MPPEPDPKAGRQFIWIVSCVLFICIAAGGGCLLAYMTIPESQSSPLLPALGFTFVCLPWIFWIVTVLYRITSRAFGFRMVIDSLYNNGSIAPKRDGEAANGDGGGGGGGGGGGAADGVNNIDRAQILDVNTKSPESSPDGRHDGDQERNVIKRTGSASSNSSNDVSVNSHESERPLALSMAS